MSRRRRSPVVMCGSRNKEFYGRAVVLKCGSPVFSVCKGIKS